MAPDDVADWVEIQAAEAKDASGRKFRKDGLCLLAGVVSFPTDWNTLRSDRHEEERWSGWQTRTVGWLKEEYGSSLMSVISHEDEGRPHIHFFVAPLLRNDGQIRISDVHDGRRAAEAAKAHGATKGEQNSAYRSAMRAYQDRYSQSVGVLFGLTRLGPQKRRLTRSEWKAEQAAARSAAHLVHVSQSARQEAMKQKTQADQAMQQAARAILEAKNRIVEAQREVETANKARHRAIHEARDRSHQIVRAAQFQSRQMVEAAEATVTRYKAVGGWLGALWSGFRGVERRINELAERRIKDARIAAAAETNRTKKALRTEIGAEVKEHLLKLREAARRAIQDSQIAASRLAKLEEKFKLQKDRLSNATNIASKEKAARQTAEREREHFRAKWADADNQLIKLSQRQQPHPRY